MKKLDRLAKAARKGKVKVNSANYNWLYRKSLSILQDHLDKLIGKDKEIPFVDVSSEDLPGRVLEQLLYKRGIKKFDPSKHAWRIFICNRLRWRLWDKYRGQKEAELLSADQIVEDGVKEPGNKLEEPITVLTAKETQGQVEAAISKIKPTYGNAFELAFRDALSVKEGAARLKVPLGTYKNYVHRGKKCFKKVIEQDLM